MALIVDQQSSFKHFCKICKKGFGCGRALGGHMRAHGIGDEGHIDDDDIPSDWEDKLAGNLPSTNKCMYALRTNPNRLKSCRVCENCGKEFLSWKSFLEHGKCSSSVDAESLVSSPGSDGEDAAGGRRGCGWSKRKRSMRAKVSNFNSLCPSSEEEDLANCLMMLSNATVDPMEMEAAEPEESCASASKEEERRNPNMNIMTSTPVSRATIAIDNNKAKGAANKGLFECKACKKVFNSHQALGGHRASHKKVKGCFAARLDHLDDSMADDDVITHEEFFPNKPNSTLQFDHGSSTPSAYTSKRKSKVHECSICHRIFSSGQALGGHKRCHWLTSNAATDTSSTLVKFNEFQESLEQQKMNQRPNKFDASDPLDLKLDLNLPAPVDENGGAGRRERPNNPSSLEVSTDFFLQPWIGTKEEVDNPHHHHHSHHQRDNDDINNNDEYNNINNNNNDISNHDVSMQNVVDEVDSKVKLAKLSELKDITTSGGSSPWLQVGIGSTTDVGADP